MFRIKYRALLNAGATVDAMVLIDLHEASALDLLNRVFSTVYIPHGFSGTELLDEEVLRGLHFAPAYITSPEGYELFFSLGRQFPALSEFDRLAIVISKETGTCCIINDKILRRACEGIGVHFSGTLGVLGCAFRCNLIGRDDLEGYVGRLNREVVFCLGGCSGIFEKTWSCQYKVHLMYERPRTICPRAFGWADWSRLG